MVLDSFGHSTSGVGGRDLRVPQNALTARLGRHARRRLLGISYQHRSHGLDDPILTEGVRQVRRGLRRTLGTAPQRLARPLSTADIRQIVTPIDRSTPKGARDAALILLGFASALRRAELTGLTLADVETKPAGLLLHVRRSKTDPDGHGQIVGVAHGQHALTDPVAALATWAGCRGDKPGPLFVNLRNKVLTDEPISGEAVARMLRTRARAAGMSTERITGHSLRAGHATTAAAAGVPLDRIALQTRHKRLSTLIERYIRRPRLWRRPPARTSACDRYGQLGRGNPSDVARGQ
jgi:integrase